MTDLAALDLDHVLRDGTTIHVRAPRTGDDVRVREMWGRLSPETVRYRFGGGVGPQPRWIDRLLGVTHPDRQVTRVATTGRGDDERIVALAQLNLLDEPGTAEFAALVEDGAQGRGIGTILLRELAEVARGRGVHRLVGDVLADNVRMLRVIRDLGLVAEQRLDGPYVHATFEVEETEAFLAAVAGEEKQAAHHAIARFLRPSTIAVVGASRSPTSVGGLVFRNILHGEFTGSLYPVNPNATSVASVAAYPSLAACPTVPDLVVVCVPAPLVADVVDQAGALGVHAVCVVSAGFAETGPGGRALQADVMARAHAHGLRVLGPNGMGLLNGSPEVRMNATFSTLFPPPGRLSLLSQSGALGLSVLARFDELGLGIASFVSVGNKADVSVDDLLLYWEDDPDTAVIALYLESFGTPRRFARVARRIGRRKPIVAVRAGRTTAGQRAASSHTAALATTDVAVEALFQQAGVIRTASLEELLGVSSLLASQSLPRGHRLAVLTNGGGPATLAADAAEAAGLTLPAFGDGLRGALASSLPAGASTANPVDMVATCTAEQYHDAVVQVAASGEVDAVLVVAVPLVASRADEVAAALAAARAEIDPALPMAVVFMGAVGRHPGASRLPVFGSPEAAVQALGRAADHAAWRRRPQGAVVRPANVDRDASRATVRDAMRARPDGGWLPADATARLLAAYGVALARSRVVTSPQEAAEAQSDLATAVAVKVDAAIHKHDVGAVVLDVVSPTRAATAVRAIDRALARAGLSAHTGRYLVQEMVPDGVEVVVGVRHDPLFGPLVMVGLGGTLVELLHDVSVRITPVTDVDVDDMLRALRGYPLLTGHRGAPPADVDALRDLLFRVSALVEDVPEVVELDLNPVFVRTRGVAAVDARLRLGPVRSRPQW